VKSQLSPLIVPAAHDRVLRVYNVRPVRVGRTIRWMASLAAAGLLVGGGVALGANLTTGSSPQANLKLVSSQAFSNQAFSSAAVTGGTLKKDLAGLRRCLATARHLAKAGHRQAARAKRRACLRQYHVGRLLLLRRLLRARAEHGQITFKTKKGTRTVAFERGLVQSATSSSVVVKASDGTTWTWNLATKTVVVRAKNRVVAHASATALAAGERVFVVGAVVGGADNARLIIIRG
jgi:hypothetical protein